MAGKTIRELAGMNNTPAAIANSALVLIDCQNTYRQGVMQLDGVEPALEQCRILLERFRTAGRPVIHIQHDAGAGSPYDISTPIGAISDIVAPSGDEQTVVKKYPSSFERTGLDLMLKQLGVNDLVLAGFMTHVCVNSTARAAFNLGYRPTVIASATATRSLPFPGGADVPAKSLHDASLAALNDMFAVVVPDQTYVFS